MMKLIKRVLIMLCCICMVLPFAACKGGNGGVTELTLMYLADAETMQYVNEVLDTFNSTVGAEQGIRIKGVPKTSAFQNMLPALLPTKGTPDIVYVGDRYFKSIAYYCADLTDLIDQEVIDDIYPGSIDRCRFNMETLTSNHDDPLYGVPYTSAPSVLFYNQTALEANGIICISVAEEDLEAFNAGTFTDGNGKTKADYGLTVNVPARGFYRSEAPYVPTEDEIDGSSWVVPSDSEIMVFNNQIAMSWDEMDDIAMVCTKTWNSDSVTQYGYYTEWWFNYGWSIGGDCIEDLSGNGDWTYSLPCDLNNYIVNEGKTFTGAYTGTVYQGGETLQLLDLLAVDKGAKIEVETENETAYYFVSNGKKVNAIDFSAEVSNGTLSELPSIQTALKRFYSLAGEGGKNVCPYPSAFGTTTSAEYFASGKIAFLAQLATKAEMIDTVLDDEFKYAPMPVYKVYTEPENPDCDTVAKQGKIASHINGDSLMVSDMSAHKKEAAVFLNWFATEGQRLRAEAGLISVRKSDSELMLQKLDSYNTGAVLDILEVATAADWWYLPDDGWIDVWANPLNNDVRNGKITFEEFIYAYTSATNKAINEIS